MTLDEILQEALVEKDDCGNVRLSFVERLIRLAWDARGEAEYQRGYEAGKRDGVYEEDLRWRAAVGEAKSL